MSTILDTIKQHKLTEVALRKQQTPISELQKSEYFNRTCYSFTQNIIDKKGIIAEFKRKSPSKGNINLTANVSEVVSGYEKAGVSAISVLTDEQFFGALPADFSTARLHNKCPMLRKEFMIDEYQIIEAKAMGADVILLIAKMISPQQIKHLNQFAKNLGLQVLIEFHTAEEIEANAGEVFDAAGINNRNLNTFEVDVKNSIALAKMLPTKTLKIAESGIENLDTLHELKNNGFDGFLIGEYFMRQANAGEACANFIKNI